MARILNLNPLGLDSEGNEAVLHLCRIAVAYDRTKRLDMTGGGISFDRTYAFRVNGATILGTPRTMVRMAHKSAARIRTNPIMRVSDLILKEGGLDYSNQPLLKGIILIMAQSIKDEQAPVVLRPVVQNYNVPGNRKGCSCSCGE
ncbi:MAG: hypothetical protein WC464_07460 [Bdellovibrionales bacterium]